MTLIFDGLPQNTIRPHFYTTSSFVYCFKTISEFKLELQSRKAQFRSKSLIFLSLVTFKFDGWPWKTIGHLFLIMSSLVHHFIAISEFKLDLQSRNAQFGTKSMIFFLSHVTFKFDRWPWKTIGYLFYAISSVVHHFIAIGKFKLEFQCENAQFGSKTLNLMDELENSRTPLLSNIKLFASFPHHVWI